MPQGKSNPVNLFHCSVSADQRNGQNGTETPECFKPSDQALPAPYGSVRPEAGAVPCQADHFTRQGVICHAGSEMGMVVLHLKKRDVLLFTHLSGRFR